MRGTKSSVCCASSGYIFVERAFTGVTWEHCFPQRPCIGIRSNAWNNRQKSSVSLILAIELNDYLTTSKLTRVHYCYSPISVCTRYLYKRMFIRTYLQALSEWMTADCWLMIFDSLVSRDQNGRTMSIKTETEYFSIKPKMINLKKSWFLRTVRD